MQASAKKNVTIRMTPAMLNLIHKRVLLRKRLEYGYSINQWVLEAVLEKLAQPYKITKDKL